MTAAVTELHPFFLSMDWKRFIVKNSATAVENDSTAEYSFVKPQLLGEPATAEQALLAAPAGLADGSQLVHLQQNSPIVKKVSFQESATDTLMAAVPDAVQAFFQRAESQLSAGTEITAQYALKLLRRIRVLVVEICPSNIQGRVFALMDEEDGSATIEWIRNRSRLGFVLDWERESSWFVVLPNGSSRSGYLYGNAGLKSLRGLLEEFVAAGE